MSLKHVFKDEFDADFENGRLYWKDKVANKVVVGKEAGYLSTDGYWYVQLHGKMHKRAKILFYLYYDYFPKTIDHINRIRSDDRLVNLREATYSENNMNRSAYSSTGIKGVYVDINQPNRYRAQIGFKGKTIYLGIFDDISSAALARANAEIRYRKAGLH